MHVRLGATKEGLVRGIDLYTLSNTGAYGEHGPTTVGLSGHKSIPLYGKAEAFRFVSDVVYTNHMSAGAYRGYGATQGLFAVESAVNELAAKLHMDPFKIREMNIVREGDVMPAYYGAVNTSCALDRCLKKVHDMIDWDNKYPVRDLGNGKVRAVGMGMAMQGSGISGMDVGSATLKVNDDGFYSLIIGAADMGTGCDTTLAQIAAEVLDCELDDIMVFGADTDVSPYDSGSYASSTTYVTGKAVEKCALKLRAQICKLGAELLHCEESEVVFDGKTLSVDADPTKKVSLSEVAFASQFGHMVPLEVTETHTSPLSPPPYMVGAAEIELDKETGEVKVVDYAACVDCGTPINPNLTRVQAEGGLLQGIGMALTENITYDSRGWPMENSFMQYKIPARVDIGRIRVEFESSYEPNGPFGAKSIGEVVINTPLPAIADAVYNAIGTRFYELPLPRNRSLWPWRKPAECCPKHSSHFWLKRAMSSRWWAAAEKTTLLYQLSAHCARKGWRVLAATTTHIRQPDHNMAHTEAECSALWAAGEYAVLGTPDGCGKLTAPPPDVLHRWMRQADAVFLEADGSKRMPCKAPASQEPVLLPECDTVLAVAGLSALGRPCGRSASGWTKPAHCCTPHRTSP